MARILIIEDNDLLAQSLESALKRFGHSLCIAHSGEIGIESYARGTFDIVITDLVMPGRKGGLAVLRYIRGSDKPHTPVVGISATPSSLERVDFNATLPKPFCLNKLRKILSELEEGLSGPSVAKAV